MVYVVCVVYGHACDGGVGVGDCVYVFGDGGVDVVVAGVCDWCW